MRDLPKECQNCGSVSRIVGLQLLPMSVRTCIGACLSALQLLQLLRVGGQIFSFIPACVSKTEFWIELHFTFVCTCILVCNRPQFHGSMTNCNGNPMQFMVSFLMHPIFLHCLLNFNMMCMYSVLAITVAPMAPKIVTMAN